MTKASQIGIGMISSSYLHSSALLSYLDLRNSNVKKSNREITAIPSDRNAQFYTYFPEARVDGATGFSKNECITMIVWVLLE